jgi:hypothetical protein
MADFDDRDEEILAEAQTEGEGSLSDEIVSKWDPDKLLRLVAKRAGRGDRLDASTRARYERKLGVDLSDVRVYTGEFAEEVTKAHSAEAVTIGTTGMILMGGSPDKSMATRSGEALLAHELTHVAQAQRGVHRKASYGEAAPLATEEHEAEAEAAESAALHGEAEGMSDADKAEEMEKKKQAVMDKVLDMFAESARVDLLRNGDWIWRP